MTQGDPVSPTIFNILVNVVVWDTLMEVSGPQEANHALGWLVGGQDTVFYANDGLISGRNPIWVQGALTTLVWTFEGMGLYTNLGKTKYMICTPVFI